MASATSLELVALDTQNVTEESVVASLSEIREVGQTLHAAYVRERLEDSYVPISDIIKRNNILTFANRPELRKKSRKDVGVQRYNMILATQLFLSLQSRPDANMADFFRFENQREPPSLADRGSLRAGKKSDILQCIGATTGRVAAAQQATVVGLEMAAIIHMVRPIPAKTFGKYVTFQIVPFLESQVTNDTQRIDAFWDSYPPEDNLKAHAQQRRGNDPRTRVGDGSTPIPKSEWNSSFLKNENNKKEFFSFISRQICKSDVNGTLLLSSYFDSVLTNRNFDVSGLQPCNQAEADTLILLHLANAAVHGHSKAYVRTVDSDIVVLALRFFETLGISELWVGFGTGKKYRDIPVHSLHAGLGPSKSIALTLFHSLTGCDTTSQFLGCGKKTAWVVWNSFPDLTDMLVALTLNPNMFGIESIHIQWIERFVVLMFSKGCSAAGVNEARLRLIHMWDQIAREHSTNPSRAVKHVK